MKRTKRLLILLTVLLLSLGAVAPLQQVNAASDGWNENSIGWWYRKSNGKYPKSEWEKISNKWYHFDDNGYMQTGWVKDGSWYYLQTSGAMKTGWHKSGGKWYYLDKTSGAMATGWQKLSGKWYYMNSSGVMQTGWIKSGKKWYYLESSGAMATSKWIGNYYVQSDGSMATNKWIGKYHVGSDGKWDDTKITHTHTYVMHYATKEEEGHYDIEYIEAWDEPVYDYVYSCHGNDFQTYDVKEMTSHIYNTHYGENVSYGSVLVETGEYIHHSAEGRMVWVVDVPKSYYVDYWYCSICGKKL